MDNNTSSFDNLSESDNDVSSNFISTENVEIEIPADEIEIPADEIGIPVEIDINKPDAKIDLTDNQAMSVNVSDFIEYNDWDANRKIDQKELNGMIDNLNGAISMIKEHKQGNELEIAEDIKANVNDTLKHIGLSDMKPEEKVEAMKKVFNNLPEGAKANIDVPGDVRFLLSEEPFDKDGRPKYQWRSNNGFDGNVEECQLRPGQVVDRYGASHGLYVCEVKNGVAQEYDPRGLPYEENPDMYHQYEIVKEFDNLKSKIESLTVEEIEQQEIQRDLNLPESERRSPEQIKEDAEDRYFTIIYDVAKACGWKDEHPEDVLLTPDGKLRDSGLASMKETIHQSNLSPPRGKIAECFSYVDENGVEHKKGGGEQIYLPASVDTLVYLGYMKEKK